MQISIMEISMSLNGNLGLWWGITQPTEKKESPTKEKKSSSKVLVSSTAANYHVLEGRYIFFLSFYVSNQASLNG